MDIKFPPNLRAQFRKGRRLAMEYCAIRAAAEVMAEKVNPIKREILKGFDLRADAHPDWPDCDGKKIENPEHLYLCGDEAGCQAYYDACEQRLLAEGLKPADMPAGYCPALVARNEQIKAERMVIEYAAAVIQQAPGADKFDANLIWGADRAKFLELAMGLMLNA